MRIQFVTKWVKRLSWGPIPNEWYLLEGFAQAGLARINSGMEPPQHRILPLQLSCDSPHTIDLTTSPKNGYDLTIVVSFPEFTPSMKEIGGYKVGITFDLPTFTEDRYQWFCEWAATLDLVFETSKDQLPTETVLVRQGVRKGAPFISSNIRTKMAFFGREERRGDWCAFLKKLGSVFVRTVPRGVFDEKLWELIPKIGIVFGAPGKPYYWSNRIYKMIEVGACFISPYIQGLEDEFVNDKDIIWRETNEEIKSVVYHYLTNHEERDAMRYQAWKAGQDKFTYCHSALKIIEALKTRGVL